MELIDAINNRRSVRSFTSKMVDKESITTLLQAAVQAPSAMNQQPWAFSIIQDKELLQQISQETKAHLLTTLDTHPHLEKYRNMFSNPDFDIFYNASTLLTIYAKEGLYAPNDCALAAQNIMLTAHSLALGTCWIGFAKVYLNTPKMKEMFHIPEEYTIVAPLIIGYPNQNSKPIKKKEPEILFWK